MNENERQNMLSEGRRYAVAAPSLLPLLAERKKNAILNLIGQFRNGKTDLIATVAEIASLQALEEDVNGKIRALDTLEKQMR